MVLEKGLWEEVEVGSCSSDRGSLWSSYSECVVGSGSVDRTCRSGRGKKQGEEGSQSLLDLLPAVVVVVVVVVLCGGSCLQGGRWR